MIPDQVVLGSGGVLGETWISSLVAGLLDAGGPDLRDSGGFVGTSAGSIVATRLAAGEDMREYVDRRYGFARSGGPGSNRYTRRDGPALDNGKNGHRLAGAAGTLLRATRPAGALLRRSLLKAVPEGSEELSRLGRTIERLMPEWDPRLSLIGVGARQGTRLVMRTDADLGLTVSEAVRASCAIPGVFAPVESSLGPVVDGGVWSPANLDAVVPPAGSTVFCLYPSGYHSRPRSLRRAATTGVSRAGVAIEAAAVRSGGVRVMVVSPDDAAAAAIGPNRMDHSRDDAAAVAGYRQGAALAQRLSNWLARAST